MIKIEPSHDVDCDDLDEMFELLLEAEVVDGPPG
jgi:hypothetical protein